MKRGDVLLATYPFTDLSGTKVRPVLAVSGDEYNQGEDIVVVPISSAPDPSEPHVFALPDSDPCFAATGLRQTSCVKWTKPMPLASCVIKRRLGILSSPLLSEVLVKIQAIFEP